jgi:hypothetical protein
LLLNGTAAVYACNALHLLLLALPLCMPALRCTCCKQTLMLFKSAQHDTTVTHIAPNQRCKHLTKQHADLSPYLPAFQPPATEGVREHATITTLSA